MRQLVALFFGILRPLRARAGLLLAVTAVFHLVAGPLAFLHEARSSGIRMPLDEAVYSNLGLFFFASSRLGYPQTIPLRFFYFLAPALAASALFGAFVRIVEERVPLFLGAFNNHMVIGGLGNLGTTLARYLERHRHPVIAIERRGDSPAVADMRESGASLVLVGDITAAGILRTARCVYAARVFFVSQSDVTNLQAAFQVRRLVETARVRRPPTIYAHVYDTALGDALEGQIHKRHEGDVRIVPFNSYRFAAKALLGDLLREGLLRSYRIAPGVRLGSTRRPDAGNAEAARPRNTPARERKDDRSLDEDRQRLMRSFQLEPEAPEASGEEAERFAIIGLGRFGRSVMRELLHAAPAAARFLVVERSEAGYAVSAEQFTPLEQARFERFIGDATGPGSIARIVAFAPTAAIICTDHDLSNLRLAMDLRRRELRAVTRMSGADASELGRGLDEQGVTIVGLSRLFRAAIPILTYERRLLACLNLDEHRTPEVDHLFYLAQTTAEERRRLGRACVSLDELPSAAGAPVAPADLALVWHRAVRELED